MKFIKILILGAFIMPALLLSSGCGDDTSTPPAKNDDNNNNTTDPIVYTSFKMGLYFYQLVLTTTGNTANYKTAFDITRIIITGNDSKQGKTEVLMEFPGNKPGIFKQADEDDVLLEITGNKGDKVKEVTYQTDPETNLIINVLEYGAVGDTIRGTFSGKLKVGINSYLVKEGKFAVQRKDDI